MNSHNQYESNTATYRRLKPVIDQQHPRGSFVAIADDLVVAAQPDFLSLERQLREQGRDPRNVLVVEAGVDYPEYVTIFSVDRRAA